MIFDTLRENLHVFPEEYQLFSMIPFVILFVIPFAALEPVRIAFIGEFQKFFRIAGTGSMSLDGFWITWDAN